MNLQVLLISLALLFLPVASTLTPCSSISKTPCSCPHGTSYSESVSWAVIGAGASDVKDLIGDFYECSWLGAAPYKTQGPDNTPGCSIRTTLFPTPVGIYNVSEILTEFKTSRDGSFTQRFEQLSSTVPLEYHSGNGSFSGYWVTLESTSIFQYETSVRWSIYACETGHARNFAKFHESGLANATGILEARGKVKGINVKAYSVQAF